MDWAFSCLTIDKIITSFHFLTSLILHREGAELLESTPVKDAVFDSSAGMWNVLIEDSDVQYRGRVLICADGSTSKLGMQLGLVTQPPQGTCSRAFIKNHKFKADGVMFYPRDILPGRALWSIRDESSF